MCADHPRRASLLLLSLICCAIGFATGYVMAGPSSSDSPKVKTAVEVVAAPHEIHRAASPPDEVSNRSSAILVAQPPSASKAPDGRFGIDGIVLEEGTRAPVPGITIRARPSMVWRSESHSVSLIDRACRRLEKESWQRENTRSAISGDSGKFHIAGLVESQSYELEADAKDELWIRRTDGYQPVRPGQAVEFQTSRKSMVEIEVRVAGDAVPPELLQLRFSMPGESRSVDWTPENREWPLDAGRYELSLMPIHGYSPVSKYVEVVPSKPLVIEVRPATGIAGSVRGELDQGGAFTCGDVHCVRSRGSLPTDDDFDRASHFRPQSDRFAFLDLEPGNYWLAIKMRSGYSTPREVAVEEGMTEVELQAPPLPPGDLVVRVFEAENLVFGDQVSNIYFWLTPLGSRTSESGLVYWQLPDGSYALVYRDEHRELLRRDDIVLKVQVDGLGARLVPVTSESTAVEARFAARASLLVLLDGYRPGLFGSINAHLASRNVSSGEEVTSYNCYAPDGRGRMHIPSQESGSHWLIVDGSYASKRFSGNLGRWPVDLEPGCNEMRIALPAIHELLVITESREMSQRIRVIAVDSEEGHGAQILEDTLARIALPTGRYRIEDRSAGAMLIDIASDASIRFDPTPSDRWVVKFLLPEGIFARAGVQLGDQILAVGGEPVLANSPSSRVLRARLELGETELPLSILRDGASLEIVLPAAKAGEDRRTLGADLQPGYPF